MGKLSGISGDITGKYERDEMKTAIDTAKKLADALSVSLDYPAGGGNSKVLNTSSTARFFSFSVPVEVTVAVLPQVTKS